MMNRENDTNSTQPETTVNVDAESFDEEVSEEVNKKKEKPKKIPKFYNPLCSSKMRNKPCPCESGKKCKVCCGKDRSVTEERVEEIITMQQVYMAKVAHELKDMKSIIDNPQEPSKPTE